MSSNEKPTEKKPEFFWLKLKNDFFDREEIKIIEAQQNGKDYIIFYMKLLLKSLKNDGRLYFRETIPYSPEMLSTITGTNIDTIVRAVDIFIGLGMMEKWDDGTLYMVETKNMIGTESKWAKYKREERAQKALPKPSKKDKIGQCPTMSKKSPIELEIEKEIEKDISFSLSSSFISFIFSFEKNQVLTKRGTITSFQRSQADGKYVLWFENENQKEEELRLDESNLKIVFVKNEQGEYLNFEGVNLQNTKYSKLL